MVGNHKVGCGEHKLTGLPRAILTNMRVVLGLLKGAVVGGALGWAAFKLGIAGGAAAFMTYALIGGLVGMVCGKPPWRRGAFLDFGAQGAVRLTVGAGLSGRRKVLGGVHVTLPAPRRAAPSLVRRASDLAVPLVGALWGGFVEVDDGGGAAADKHRPKAAA